MTTKVTPAPLTRSLREIALEIAHDWPQASEVGAMTPFGPAQHPAGPYLHAMLTLDKLDDSYFMDSASSIVRYFLANAGSWRGEKARAIEAELKAALAWHDGRYDRVLDERTLPKRSTR